MLNNYFTEILDRSEWIKKTPITGPEVWLFSSPTLSYLRTAIQLFKSQTTKLKMTRTVLEWESLRREPINPGDANVTTAVRPATAVRGFGSIILRP